MTGWEDRNPSDHSRRYWMSPLVPYRVGFHNGASVVDKRETFEHEFGPGRQWVRLYSGEL